MILQVRPRRMVFLQTVEERHAGFPIPNCAVRL
jgi:hypothetical protein